MKIYSGERVYLRKIQITDITERVMEWFEDKELMEFYTNSKKTITKESLIESIKEGEKRGNLYTFGIFTKDSETLIGTIKLGPINFSHRISDLVILIGDRNYLGKGLAVEAIKTGNQLAFEEFDIRKLYGGMYESNIPSIKAYTRAGWIIEGRLKGFYLHKGNNEDRILVCCLNPKYFLKEEIEELESVQDRYFQF
ncbi:Protein N-acetyltransferase, RimJ/RimL family [Salegentibacter holothuriorum]|uniref:Protein N-acetyltransferase, RimJ/RimL family n=1 Tax=Salegentibacter holothuriorum TaxID=241145 RepID=A0A1T5AQ34_9FLAO|nr:GNAT family protein [Salegentibacter holothuriorum]SKB36937.1 Protein N-acetyltransferase, RimJ/RimL family [Salegentibacter holothuriorum]